MTTDNKVYKTIIEFGFPDGWIKAGTKSIKWEDYFVFPYVGKKFNDDNNGWLGNGYMCAWPENYPKFFEEIKPENKSNDSFQWTDELVKEYASNWMEAANKNENYISIESFKQYHSSNEVCGVDINWVVKYCHGDLSKVMKPEDCRFIGTREECHDFVKKYKPQAENKPDWEIVAFEIHNKVFYLSNYDKHTNRIWFGGIGKGSFVDKQDWDEWLAGKRIPQLFKIHSVKRLSDNLVFSIGDEAGWDLEQCPGNSSKPFTITCFGVFNNRMFCNNQNICIDYIQKKSAPQPQKEERKGWFVYEDAPKSKPTEQRIEVLDVGFSHNNREGEWYSFCVKQNFPIEKYRAIKQAIEQVLNNH